MLTADMVRTRLRGGKIHLPPLTSAEVDRALALSDLHLELARTHVGETREALIAAWDELGIPESERLLVRGLRKLILDACVFQQTSDDARQLRADVFPRAAAAWRGLGPSDVFDRDGVLRPIAEERGIAPSEVDRLLFADLPSAQLLLEAPSFGPKTLVARYKLGRVQAILLRAVHLECIVRPASAEGARKLFRALKFHQLLFDARRDGDAYVLRVDGPFSMFEAVTRYGMKFAMLVPIVAQAGEFSLRAEVVDRRSRRAEFRIVGSDPAFDGLASVPKHFVDVILPEELAALERAIDGSSTPWTARPARALLFGDGGAVVVPDLEFQHRDGGPVVYFELLGYWSREAVWRRVELIKGGFAHKVVFGVRERLRVSEEVLEADTHGAIVVFKDSLRPRKVLEKLDALART
jgi:predicted nuclease of restriction endonuclease-like RecB superfamily